MHILVVDASVLFQNLIGDALHHAGCITDVAATCQRAVECLATRLYACIVLERVLPDGDGLDVLRIRPYPAECVLMFTMHPVTPSLRLLAHSYGVRRIFRKPDEFLDLIRVIVGEKESPPRHREKA